MLPCLKRYRKIIFILRTCAKCVGADITAPNYRINIITYIVIISTLTYFVFTYYTIHVGMVINGNWTVLVQALATSTSALEGLVKLFYCIKHRKLMAGIQNLLDETYCDYEQKGKSYQRTLQKRLNITYNLIKTFLWGYIICFTCIVMFPVIYLTIFNERTTVLQFLLPGVDPNTEYGYWIHYASHVMLLSFGAFGNYASDMYLFIFIVNIPLIKDIIRCKFNDLNKISKEDIKARLMLIDIIEWHQKYISLIDETDQVFFIVVFVQVCGKTFSIVATIFCMFIGAWPAGGGYLAIVIATLYTYCWLGNVVEDSNEDLTSVIYENCTWYEFQQEDKKLILIMLHKTQVAQNITVGKIMPLSMTTGVQLTKLIYTYLMMLVNYVE